MNGHIIKPESKKVIQKTQIKIEASPYITKQTIAGETSEEVWPKLKNIYQGTSTALKESLPKQLILKKADKDDVREHLANFMGIVDELVDMAINII